MAHNPYRLGLDMTYDMWNILVDSDLHELYEPGKYRQYIKINDYDDTLPIVANISLRNDVFVVGMSYDNKNLLICYDGDRLYNCIWVHVDDVQMDVSQSHNVCFRITKTRLDQIGRVAHDKIISEIKKYADKLCTIN